MSDHENGDTRRLRLILGYVVLSVWTVIFLAATFFEVHSPPIVYLVQAVMMLVAGGLYADWRLRKRNGR